LFMGITCVSYMLSTCPAHCILLHTTPYQCLKKNSTTFSICSFHNFPFISPLLHPKAYTTFLILSYHLLLGLQRGRFSRLPTKIPYAFVSPIITSIIIALTNLSSPHDYSKNLRTLTKQKSSREQMTRGGAPGWG